MVEFTEVGRKVIDVRGKGRNKGCFPSTKNKWGANHGKFCLSGMCQDCFCLYQGSGEEKKRVHTAEAGEEKGAAQRERVTEGFNKW